jgi:hypothetical protein
MLAQGRFLPDYLFDPELRLEIRRRSNLGGPPLLPAPSGLAIRKADYAFDLEAPGYREQIEKIFAAHDRDGDGVITSSEYDDPSDWHRASGIGSQLSLRVNLPGNHGNAAMLAHSDRLTRILDFVVRTKSSVRFPPNSCR